MRCAEAQTFGLIWPGKPVLFLLFFFKVLGVFWPGRCGRRRIGGRRSGDSRRAGQGCIEAHRARRRPPAGTHAAGRNILGRQGGEGGLQ